MTEPGKWSASRSFKALQESMWEVGKHLEQEQGGWPTCWPIFGRHGKREEDRTIATYVASFTYRGDELQAEKMEYFRKIAQQICDEHNKALKP